MSTAGRCASLLVALMEMTNCETAFFPIVGFRKVRSGLIPKKDTESELPTLRMEPRFRVYLMDMKSISVLRTHHTTSV